MDTAAFPSFAPLLAACDNFAQFSGGRYTWELISDVRGDQSEEDKARNEALPVVMDYIERIKDSADDDAQLVQEFHVAEIMAIQEAVFTSMVSTCRSVDLWPSGAPVASDDTTYQDMAEPLEHVAQRLYNYVQVRKQMNEEGQHWRKMSAASFIVEFGRAHGLAPSEPDAAAQQMLMDFLVCVKEWGERMHKPSFVPNLELLPNSLRGKAEQWWHDHHRKLVFGSAMILMSAAVLGASVAYISSIAGSVVPEFGAKQLDDG